MQRHPAGAEDAAGQLATKVADRILMIRGHRVLLDADLAAVHGVSTKQLNRQVRRTRDRFPADFVLELTNQELAALRSQFVTLKGGRGTHRKYPPVAFTEHGAIMTAAVLNSARAVQMSVYIVRAFVRFRAELMKQEALARELEASRNSVASLDQKTRRQFDQVHEAILGLMAEPSRRQ
ncbi:MAG TPA: ORF6N domain-containing protein [Steroidobacteraceae bacterium]|nr:ORF6N domain-containing protein [Steroidobacteraceae bacterium]